MARPPVPRVGTVKSGLGAQKKATPADADGERPKTPGVAKNSKNATLVLAIVAMLVLALFERPVCLLLVLALVPTMLAWLIDDTPGQSLIRTVASLNLASSLPFAIKLWHEHNSLDQVFVFMSSEATWVALYGAAVFGWMLYYLAPALISAVVQRRIERLRETAIERQKALKDEWGDEVAQ